MSASNYPITLSGAWINKTGINGFMKREGAVTLDGGNQVLSGSTVFQNLSKIVTTAQTLLLEGTAVQRVSGSLVLRGGVDNLLKIRSTSSGSLGASLRPISAQLGSTTPTCDALNYNLGHKFTANTNGYVTQLGVRVDNTAARTVRLYRFSDSAVLASATINGVNSTTWVYVDITPVSLTSGQSYVISEQGTTRCYTACTYPFTQGDITVNDSRYSTSIDTMPYNLDTSYAHGLVDFTFIQSSTQGGSGAMLVLDADSGTQDLSFLDVKDNDASGGVTLECSTSDGCVDSGNNTNWSFGVAPPVTSSITGTIYSDEGTTPLNSGTVAVSVNAAAKVTDAVDGGGQFTITGLTLTGGSLVTLWIDDGTPDAVTVTCGSGSSMTGVHLYQNRLIIRSNTGSSANAPAMTNTKLAIADNVADSDVSSVYWMADTNTTLQLASGKELYVWPGSQFTPGGRVKSHDLEVKGTMAMGMNGLTLSGSFIANAGTFTTGTGTLLHSTDGDAASPESLTLGSNTLNNLTLNNGLVGYWKLDDGSGSTLIRDDSGNRNNGTWNGAGAGSTKPQWKQNPSHASRFFNPRALDFDGMNDYISATLSPGLNDPLTISFWKNLDTFANTWPHGFFANNINLGYSTSGDFYSAGLYFNANYTVLDSWQYMTYTMDGTNIRLYVDGILKDSKTFNPSTVTTMNMGCQSNASWMDGMMDDFRIYGRVLSASEIVALASGYPNTGSGVYLLGSNLALNESLTIQSGEIRTRNAQNVTLSGSWMNHGGFTSTGTVILDGGIQTMSGSSIFKNLTKIATTATTLFFDFRAQQSVSGSLVLNGSAGQLLSLRSTKTGSASYLMLDADATQSASDLRYLNVKDNNASGGQQLVCSSSTEGCVDEGNTTNWLFLVAGKKKNFFHFFGF
ncbi:MAG: DUF4082 domain-containing protein [Candidatus Peribacteraceae bacterium]|nr:DUF4082 domain-containing protein [Candidatus Peribacteraceae bacterium]